MRFARKKKKEENINWDGIERRIGTDRRKGGLPTWRILLSDGARASIRRQEDRNRFLLLDRYSSALFIMTVFVLLLSATDAFLTLVLINHGATELNPVMAYFLGFGPLVFISVKYLLTSLSVFIIVLFNQSFIHKTKLYVSNILTYACGVFSTVVVWELFLYYRFVH